MILPDTHRVIYVPDTHRVIYVPDTHRVIDVPDTPPAALEFRSRRGARLLPHLAPTVTGPQPKVSSKGFDAGFWVGVCAASCGFGLVGLIFGALS